jgi:transcriptional regulator with XRE-family HTH domain
MRRQWGECSVEHENNHGLAIREVGRRLGRSRAYLSQIERGIIRQPDPVVLLELAELYRLDFVTGRDHRDSVPSREQKAGRAVASWLGLRQQVLQRVTEAVAELCAVLVSV